MRGSGIEQGTEQKESAREEDAPTAPQAQTHQTAGALQAPPLSARSLTGPRAARMAGPPDPATVLWAQRSAGNAAVARMLKLQAAGPVIARDDPPGTQAPARPARPARLAAGQNFRWFGTNEAPVLAIRRSWLTGQGVASGSSPIVGEDHPGVLRPIVADLLERYPWTQPRRAEILDGTGTLRLELSPQEWEQEEMEARLDRSVFLTIGLPPDFPIQVYPTRRGIEVYADLNTLYPGGAAPDDTLRGQIAERVVAAVERHVDHAMLPDQRPALVHAVSQALPDRPATIPLPIDETWLHRVYGEQRWREQLAARPVGEGGGTVIQTAGGAYQASPDISPEDAEMAQRVLQEIFGPAPADAAAPERAMQLSPNDLTLLRAIDRSPELKAEMRQLLRGGGGAAPPAGRAPQSLEDALRTLMASVDMRRFGKMLQVPMSQGGGAQRDPIVRRPVHGDVVNRTGELVPRQEARFGFRTTDQVDAFRVPHVRIAWVAVERNRDSPVTPAQPGAAPAAAPSLSGGSVIRRENTSYVELGEEGLLNDKTFQVTFPRTGTFEIHAFVDHNFFLPAHFWIPVEVRTEDERLAAYDRRAEESFGATTGQRRAHDFSDVRDQGTTIAIAAGLANPALIPLGALGAYQAGQYAQGTRAEGDLSEQALASGGSVSRQRAQIQAQIEQLEALRARYSDQSEAAADMRSYIDGRLARLRATSGQLEQRTRGGGIHQVICQGSYVSRGNQARGGPLSLAAWFTHSESDGYRIQMLDHSELVRNEDLHFEATGRDYERTMERMFFELSRTYPDGSMTFAFQQYDGLTPSTRFVRYQRRTDTVLQDVRNVAFSQPVSIAVNIATTVMMVFPPTTAAGVMLSITYNGAAAALELAEARRTGTDSTRHYVQLGAVALDVIPGIAAARGVRLAGRTMWIVNSAQHGANAYMVTDSVRAEIIQLRDGSLSELADLQAEIARLRQLNPSDPTLEEKEERARRLEIEVRRTADTVIRRALSEQAITLALTATAGRLAEEAHTASQARRAGGGAGDDAPAAPHGSSGDAPSRPAQPQPRPHDAPGPAPHDGPGPTPHDGPDPAPHRDAPGGARGLSPAAPELAAALPAHLQRQVPVLVDPSLGTGVRVHYTRNALGLVDEVHVRVGPNARPEDVALHVRTIETMRGYSGLSGALRTVFDHLRALVGRRGMPPVGSLAWEAKLELEKLPGVIADRARRLEAMPPPAEAAALQSELDGLRAQMERHRRTLERWDVETGVGYVAAEGDHSRAAVEAGYPSLERAPGHYYVRNEDGTYSLVQRAESTSRPMRLVRSGDGFAIEPAPTRASARTRERLIESGLTGPGVDHLERITSAAQIEQLATADAATLGMARELSERLGPHLQDARLADGVTRHHHRWGAQRLVEFLHGVPRDNLGLYLRALADPDLPVNTPQGRRDTLRTARDDLLMIQRVGYRAYDEIGRHPVLGPLFWERMNQMDPPAAAREAQRLMGLRPQEREAALGIQRDRSRSAQGLIQSGSAEQRATAHTEANEVFDRPRTEPLEDPRTHAPYTAANEALARQGYAEMVHVRNRVNARLSEVRGWSYEQKIELLARLDRMARENHVPTTWANNLRGSIAERIFGPHSGQQRSITNRRYPARGGGAGRSRFDDHYEPGTRPGATDRAVGDYVEIKSHSVTEEDAVTTANKHAREGLQDWHALVDNFGQDQTPGVVIIYVRKPPPAAQAQMLARFFAPDSPFAAVCFGDPRSPGNWHQRPAGSPMPPFPPPLPAAGAAVVPAGAGAGPSPVDAIVDGDD